MNKEINYLYRSFNPRIASYESDGKGRDSYISCDNGGMKKVPAKQKIENSTQYSLNKHNHVFKLK